MLLERSDVTSMPRHGGVMKLPWAPLAASSVAWCAAVQCSLHPHQSAPAHAWQWLLFAGTIAWLLFSSITHRLYSAGYFRIAVVPISVPIGGTHPVRSSPTGSILVTSPPRYLLSPPALPSQTPPSSCRTTRLTPVSRPSAWLGRPTRNALLPAGCLSSEYRSFAEDGSAGSIAVGLPSLAPRCLIPHWCAGRDTSLHVPLHDMLTTVWQQYTRFSRSF